MQYQNIPTVRLLIIAEILGLIAAELLPGRAAAFKCVSSHRKRSTTRQLLDVARSLAVPRQDGGKLVLFETSYGVRRYLEPSLRCFLPRCFFSPYKIPIQKTKPRISAIISSRTVAVVSYCLSHCGFEGGNIPSAWNSNRLWTEKYTRTGSTGTETVKYQVVRGTSLLSV